MVMLIRGGRSEAGTVVEGFLRGCDRLFLLVTPTGPSAFSATGHVRPRSFPRLAIPTPHVKVVLYPEQSFPISRHWPQYGLLRSQGAFRFRHAKQSSAAPVVVVLLRRFLMVGLVSGPTLTSDLMHAVLMAEELQKSFKRRAVRSCALDVFEGRNHSNNGDIKLCGESVASRQRGRSSSQGSMFQQRREVIGVQSVHEGYF